MQPRIPSLDELLDEMQPRIPLLDESLAMICTETMCEAIEAFKKELAQRKVEGIRKYLENNIKKISQLITKINIATPREMMSELNALQSDVNDHWARQSIGDYLLPHVKNPKNGIKNEFTVLVDRLKKLVALRGRYNSSLLMLDQQAKGIQGNAIKNFKKTLANGRLYEAQLIKEMNGARQDSESIGITAHIIDEKLTAFTAMANFLKNQEKLEALFDVFKTRMMLAQDQWPQPVVHYYNLLETKRVEIVKNIEELETKKTALIGLYSQFTVSQSRDGWCQYLEMLKKLEMLYKDSVRKLSDAYEKQVKKYMELFNQIQGQLIRDIDEVSLEYSDLTEEEINDFLRSVQNNGDVKKIFENFTSKYRGKLGSFETMYECEIKSMADSIASMQTFKENIDNFFDELFKRAAGETWFREQLSNVKLGLQQKWEEQIKEIRRLAEAGWVEIDKFKIKVSESHQQINQLNQALHKKILIIARDELCKTIQLEKNVYQKSLYQASLEDKKILIKQRIELAIRLITEPPIQKLDFQRKITDLHKILLGTNQQDVEKLIQALDQLVSREQQAEVFNTDTPPTHQQAMLSQRPSLLSVKDKQKHDAFIKRLFMQHWKAMLMAGLIGAIIMGSILTGGLFATVISLISGAGTLASLLHGFMPIAMAIGGLVTSSPATAATIGMTILSLCVGIGIGVVTGLFVTVFDSDGVLLGSHRKKPSIQHQPSNVLGKSQSYVGMTKRFEKMNTHAVLPQMTTAPRSSAGMAGKTSMIVDGSSFKQRFVYGILRLFCGNPKNSSSTI